MAKMVKYRELNVDIHRPDGGLGSSDRWYYPFEEYKKYSSRAMSRKYWNEQYKGLIDAGYIIGNIWWSEEPNWGPEATKLEEVA